MNKTLVLVVLFALVLLGCRQPENLHFRGGTSHLPLLHGRTMHYEYHTAGGTQEVTLQMSYLGGHNYKVFPVKFTGIDLGSCEFHSKDSSVYFETDKPRTNLESTDELAVFRELWVTEGVEEGNTWENPDTGTQTLFAGYQDVSTPAGSFGNCYKTVTEAQPALFDSLKAWHNRGKLSDKEFDRKMADAKKIVARWFAPKVGLVKEEINNGEQSMVLLSVDNEGTGMDDTTKIETREIHVQ